MLYATVRNRKISVKKPNVVPCNGVNVDFLTLDLDDDWKDVGYIVCTFTNEYVTEQKQGKTVTEETKVTTVTKDEAVISTETNTNTEEQTVDLGDETAFEEGTSETTSTETAQDDEAETKTTIVTTTKVTKTIVSTSVPKKEAKDVGTETGENVKIPNECIQNPGQLSVTLTGYDREDTAGRTIILTTAVPDSYWELVENGKIADEAPNEEETASLLDQALALVGEANQAVGELKQKAADGAFNGGPGPQGKSAYEVAAEHGYEGSEEAWLASLKGLPGAGVGECVHSDFWGTPTVEPYYPVYSEIFNDYERNKSTGKGTHVEGCMNEALSNYAHVEGAGNKAGYVAHAEGSSNEALGQYSHAEGHKTQAAGDFSHSQNLSTKALGNASTAGGYGTVAREECQTVFGKFNKDNPDAVFIVGNGANDQNRSNAFEVMKDGTIRAKSLNVNRHSCPFAIDFKAFAAMAAKQDWWTNLNNAKNTAAEGVKIVGVIEDAKTATGSDIVATMDEWMRNNLNWYITNFTDRATGYSNAYGGHALAIDPAGTYYGVRFLPYESRVGDQTKRTLNLTFCAPGAGKYAVNMESFFESGPSVNNRLVPCPWNYRSGAYVDVYVNGVPVKSRVPIGNTDTAAEQCDTLVDIGTVALDSGENTLTLDVVQGYWGQGHAINLSNISFIPQWMDFRMKNG